MSHKEKCIVLDQPQGKHFKVHKLVVVKSASLQTYLYNQEFSSVKNDGHISQEIFNIFSIFQQNAHRNF